MTETRRVPIAEIPAGQGINLFVAVTAVLDAALEPLGRTMLGPGSGSVLAGAGSASTVSLDTEESIGRICQVLERAALKLRKKPKPLGTQPEPELDGEIEMTVDAVKASDDGIDLVLGMTGAQTTLVFLADTMREALGDAKNYVQMEIRDPNKRWERFWLTVQRAEGKSPATLRDIAEARVAELEAVVARVSALADRWEHGALRWAEPLPVPPEVAQVRAALAGTS
ncbi:hypothetical protein D1871_11015 [Nakamurella silvestris]|nr:hypothetical protein D1871_11015 [Nakamurella silvestris]